MWNKSEHTEGGRKKGKQNKYNREGKIIAANLVTEGGAGRVQQTNTGFMKIRCGEPMFEGTAQNVDKVNRLPDAEKRRTTRKQNCG